MLFSSEIELVPEQLGSLYLSGAFSSPKFLNEVTIQGGNIGRTASCNEIKDHQVTIHLRSPLFTLLLLLLGLFLGAFVCDHTPSA